MKDARTRADDPFDKLLDVHGCVGRERIGFLPSIKRLDRPAQTRVYDDHCHSAFLSQQIARIYERQLFSHLYPGDIHRGQASIHLDDVTGLAPEKWRVLS